MATMPSTYIASGSGRRPPDVAPHDPISKAVELSVEWQKSAWDLYAESVRIWIDAYSTVNRSMLQAASGLARISVEHPAQAAAAIAETVQRADE